MKIGLVGTMSVGKTTLAKVLGGLDQFKDYTVQTERSKYLSNLGIPLNTDSTLSGQFIFLAERATELLQPNIITDRTIWDVCAFTLSAKSISDSEKRAFVEAAMCLRDYYDVVVYVSPRGVAMENNGIRETDLGYRMKIDNAIQLALEEFKPKRLISVEGTTDERIATILQNI
jgi:ABC-type glutathione transport system ATPase component